MPLTPTRLASEGDQLVVQWSDGVVHRLPWSFLRKRCPCATCRVQRNEPPALLPVLTVEETRPVKGTAMQPLGNYAYAIHFSDGHQTGIYTLEFLRALGEERASSESNSA